MNPIKRKSMSKLVMQPSFSAVGQTRGKPQEKNKIREMNGSQASHAISLVAKI